MEIRGIRTWELVGLGLALAVAGCGGGEAEVPPARPPAVTAVASAPAPTPAAPAKGVDPELAARLASPDAHKPFIPAELPGIFIGESAIPADNPMTPAKVELGRQLYFDKRLSKDSTVSCATCHDPAKGWTDQAPVSTGIGGQKGGRSAPTVMNRILTAVQFWDGRAKSLEEQALGPIGNPIEMGFSADEASSRLAGIPGYALQFDKVFGGPPKPEFIAKAIAAFERTVLAGGAPNDYFELAEPFLKSPGDASEDAETKAKREKVLADYQAHPMDESAMRGRTLYFNKAHCSLCHVGPNLADELYHNLGVGMDKPEPDLGRFKTTQVEKDKGAFKTPTLRNITSTAPYMHDGSEATLKSVVELYNRGGNKNQWLSPKIQPLGLTEAEIGDLVHFMEQGLTGTVTAVTPPKLPE